MFQRKNTIILLLITLIFASVSVFAASKSKDNVWQKIDDANLKKRPIERFIVPEEYLTFRLDKVALQTILTIAPIESVTIGYKSEVILTLPMPDGTFERFAIKESPIMEPELAAKFPEIKTYLGQGIDNSTATTRFDFMPSGFHAIILSDKGTVYIDPYAKGDMTNYISYYKADLGRNPSSFICEVGEKETPLNFNTPEFKIYEDTPNIVTNGTMLKQYRLAVAATNEYAVAVGGNTIAGTLAAQVLIMNRVNGVYERELAVRMNIIANNNLILYAGDNVSCGGACTAGNDPYTNDDGFTMLGENTTNLNAVIGSANYDIGHVFSTDGGGVATLLSPCSASKARGVTGLPNPVGDPFAIDFVSHEIGHQYGGSHTFNGSSSNCSNRSSLNAFEPGSGSTIQAYAGICSPQNLQRNSNDYFHVRSLEQMVAFITNAATGGSCSPDSATGNTPPSISVVGGTTYNIPANTPFELTASGNDNNGDTITYNWEEYDLGPADTIGQPPSATADAPIFRSYSATTSPNRFFPSLQYILNNNNIPPSTYTCGGSTCITGEVLPAITRAMTFQVTARDNRAGGGGVNSTTATVNVDAGSGPFKVTAQDSLIAPNWQANTLQTVTWDVANTTAAPVSAANVMILLSTDGGNTFPTVISASTTNDGTEQIVVPNMPTTMARLKVQAVGNIFFDISNVNFTITAPTAAGASVRGQVVTSNGRGINRTSVKLTNTTTGESYNVVTNPFGYFIFEDVPVGNLYVMTVRHKRYEFQNPTQTFNLSEDLTGVTFVGQ